jgi:hypothetical protein
MNILRELCDFSTRRRDLNGDSVRESLRVWHEFEDGSIAWDSAYARCWARVGTRWSVERHGGRDMGE